MYDTTDAKIEGIVQEKPSRKKYWIAGICSLLILMSIGFIYRSSANNEIDVLSPTPQQLPVSETVKDTILTIATQEASSTATRISVPITIDTGENSITAVELHLTFSPIPNNIISLLPSTFFPSPAILQNDVNQASGTATLVVGSTVPKRGNGTIAVITLNKQAMPSDIQIRFSQNTRVAAINEKGSVIKNLISGTLSY